MPRIGVRDLRRTLADALRRAEGGERIVITVDGRAVAQLGPVESATRTATLDELVERGLLLPPRRADAPPRPAAVAVLTGVRLDRALDEIRGR